MDPMKRNCWERQRDGNMKRVRAAFRGVKPALSWLRSVSKTEWLALTFTLLSVVLWWISIEVPDQNAVSHLHSP